MTVLPGLPGRLWIAAPCAAQLHQRLTDHIPQQRGAVTQLGHAFTVLRLSGPKAAEVLARDLAVDLHPSQFPSGSVALTSIQDVSVTLHRVRDLGGSAMYDLYLPRGFARALFERLCHTAQGFATSSRVERLPASAAWQPAFRANETRAGLLPPRPRPIC